MCWCRLNPALFGGLPKDELNAINILLLLLLCKKDWLYSNRYEHCHGARNFEVKCDICNKDIIWAPAINYCRVEYGDDDDDDDGDDDIKHSSVLE